MPYYEDYIAEHVGGIEDFMDRIDALETEIWTTASGRRIPFNELTDEHIQNIIRLFGDRELYAEAVGKLKNILLEREFGGQENRMTEAWLKDIEELYAQFTKQFPLLPTIKPKI